MFKISHKLNYFSHVNIFSRFRNKQKMPVVEKPLVSYMLFKKLEPSSDEIIKELGEQITETASSILGFSGILSSISDLSDAKRKAAIKQEQKTEKITQTQRIEKNEETYEDNDDDYDYDDTSYVYQEKKQSLFARVMSNFANSVSEIIYSIQDWNYRRKARKEEKRRMAYEMRAQLEFQIKNNEFLPSVNKKMLSQILLSKKISVEKLQKVVEQTNDLIETQRQKEAERLQKQNEIDRLRTAYEHRLAKYKNMFADGDMQPDISDFNNYCTVNIDKLKAAMSELSKLIKHQKIINELKTRYQQGAANYANFNDNNKLKNSPLKEINPNNKRNMSYRKELKKRCRVFLYNSQIVEEAINAFNNVSKTYFRSANKKLKNIFEIKSCVGDFERIPYVGILPKSVRVADEYNLTKCILKDFEDITQEYVVNGMQPTMKKYRKQYDEIDQFTKTHEHSSEDEKYTKVMLNLISDVQNERNEIYAKLFLDFVKAGASISNICNNLMLKDGVAMTLKLLKLKYLLG